MKRATLFFQAEDGQHGKELWQVRADGSVSLISDIHLGMNAPALSDQAPVGVQFNGAFYFKAESGVYGKELWRVTPDGLVALVADIAPGTHNSLDQSNFNLTFVSYRSELYFGAADMLAGPDLWKVKANGSVAKVADLNPGLFVSPPIVMADFNNELYFWVSDGLTGTALHKLKTDGGVVDVTGPGGSSLFVGPAQSSIVFGNELYFRASDSISKVKADGSVSVIANVSGDVSGFNIFNNELYFANSNGLFKVAAGGTAVLVAGIGVVETRFSSSTIFNGEMCFCGSDGAHGAELWKVKADGSVVLAADVNPGSGSSFDIFRSFAVFDGDLYFKAGDGTHGRTVEADGGRRRDDGRRHPARDRGRAQRCNAPDRVRQRTLFQGG